MLRFPPGSGVFLTLRSGMGKKSGSGSGMNYWETIFWVKLLKSFDANPGFGMEKFGSGMEKFKSGINIPDPHHWVVVVVVGWISLHCAWSQGRGRAAPVRVRVTSSCRRGTRAPSAPAGSPPLRSDTRHSPAWHNQRKMLIMCNDLNTFAVRARRIYSLIYLAHFWL